jgi:penicillin amidase
LSATFHDELPEDLWPDGGGRWYTVMAALLDNPDDPFWNDVTTIDVETRDDILTQAARDARDDMTRLQGKDPQNWAWGRLHVLEPRELTFGSSGIAPVEWLFNREPVELGGGPAVVLATGWNAAEGFETIWAPSMRMVVDLADFDRSRWIDLTGVSGHPRHEHYGDQMSLWQEGKTLPMRWSREAISDAAEHFLTLVPEATP